MYSQAEYMFILKNYFASELFIAGYEALCNAYPGKVVPNKTVTL
jgi:hypothetical protein